MTWLTIAVFVFPYDPSLDSVVGHQHLVVAYCLTWIVHLCYLFYVLRKWYAAGKPEADAGGYEPTQER